MGRRNPFSMFRGHATSPVASRWYILESSCFYLRWLSPLGLVAKGFGGLFLRKNTIGEAIGSICSFPGASSLTDTPEMSDEHNFISNWDFVFAKR